LVITLSSGTALENKHGTKCDIRQEFSQPSLHATGAAPTGRRRNAGQAAEIGRRSSDRRSRSSNREFHFAELGTFALEPGTFAPESGTFAREQGGYCANPGTFSICSTVSFRQLLANSSEPARRPRGPRGASPCLSRADLTNPHPLEVTSHAGMRQLIRRLMNTLKFIPLWFAHRTFGHKHLVRRPNAAPKASRQRGLPHTLTHGNDRRTS
jgi:hypothetical protein